MSIAYISHHDADTVSVCSLIVDGELIQLAVECEVFPLYDFAVCNDGIGYVGIVFEW